MAFKNFFINYISLTLIVDRLERLLIITRMISDNRTNDIVSMFLIYLRAPKLLAYRYHFLAPQVLLFFPLVNYHSPMPMMAMVVVAMVSFPPLLFWLFLMPPSFLLIRSNISLVIRPRYI